MLCNRNCFKISINLMIYKMTLLPLPRVRDVTEKGYRKTNQPNFAGLVLSGSVDLKVDLMCFV